MKRLLILALLLAAAGCMPPPPNVDELRALAPDTAPPDSAATVSQLRSHFELQLYDPASAMFKCGTPAEGLAGPVWYKATDGKLYAGYGVAFYLNAKNRMGGYVGWEAYMSFFRDGQLRGTFTGMEAKFRKGRKWDWM